MSAGDISEKSGDKFANLKYSFLVLMHDYVEMSACEMFAEWVNTIFSLNYINVRPFIRSVFFLNTKFTLNIHQLILILMANTL